MADLTYVRRDMIPPEAPPRSQVGVVRWLHEKLFSSWLNGILTVLCLYLLWLARRPRSCRGSPIRSGTRSR